MVDGLKLRCNTECFSDTSEATKDSKAKPGVPQRSPLMPPPGRWPCHSARSPSTGATTAAWPESSVPAGLQSQSSKPIASSLGSQKPPSLLLLRRLPPRPLRIHPAPKSSITGPVDAPLPDAVSLHDQLTEVSLICSLTALGG